jgi:hypothetical protein
VLVRGGGAGFGWITVSKPVNWKSGKLLRHEIVTTVDAVMRRELIVHHAATQLDFTSICSLKQGLHRIM